MAIEFRCDQCGQLLRVPDNTAGKSARCPKCQAMMTIPAQSPPGGAGPATGPTAPPAAPVSQFPSTPTGPTDQPAPLPTLGAPTSSSPFGSPPAGGSLFEGAPLSPPPKPAGNPFGEGGMGAPPGANPFGQPSEANPYASPSSIYTPPSGQQGLPWEVKGQNFGTWLETTKLFISDATRAFTIMLPRGKIGGPMVFALLGMSIGGAGGLFWNLVMLLGIGVFAGANGQADAAAPLAIQAVTQVGLTIVGTLLGATLFLLIQAAIIHVCCLIVGGGKTGFDATFRVLAYSNGSLAFLQWIPIAGGFVLGIWVLILVIIGLAKVHDMHVGKTILAVFLPAIVCCVAILGILVLAGGAGALMNAR